MTDVRTIYAVTSGEYSSYSVDCLFESEDHAKQYADATELAYGRHWNNCDCRSLDQHRKAGHILLGCAVEPFQLWTVVPIATYKAGVVQPEPP